MRHRNTKAIRQKVASEVFELQNFIRYNLEIEDMAVFTEYQLLRSQKALERQRRMSIQLAIVTFLMYFLAGIFLRRSYPSILGLWFPPLMALSGTALYNYPVSKKICRLKPFRKRILKYYSEGENKGLFCEHVLTLVENGFIERTDYNETRFSWGGLERIESEKDYTYLYTSANSAYVIPHQKVIEGDLALFLNGIKTHYKPDQLLEP